jgi:hypothetical protein
MVTAGQRLALTYPKVDADKLREIFKANAERDDSPTATLVAQKIGPRRALLRSSLVVSQPEVS